MNVRNQIVKVKKGIESLKSISEKKCVDIEMKQNKSNKRYTICEKQRDKNQTIP